MSHFHVRWGEVGKDPLTWATILREWEDGSEDVLCLLHTVGVDQEVLPVGIDGILARDSKSGS